MGKRSPAVVTVAKMYLAFIFALVVAMSPALHSFAAVNVDRIRLTYADSAPYRSSFKDRMNCYGYALHVYCKPFMGGGYKQHPGEFYDGGYSHQVLFDSYENAFYLWKNLYYFVHDRIGEDFWYLNRAHGEYNKTETYFGASIPPGKRMIALVIRQNHNNPDFHFYVRDDNGLWSHKQGHCDITNLSIDSDVPITDSNFLSVCTEGQYSDGTRFYLIDKPYIIDYGHAYEPIESSNATVTPLLYRDRAGASMVKSAIVTSSAVPATFDYQGDVDFFCYTPSISGNYRIETNYQGIGKVTNMFLFDGNAGLIWYDLNSSYNASMTYYLQANNKYFVQVIEQKRQTYDYTFSVYRI